MKKAGYKTYFTGKWHLGESDYALPNALGYDVMEHAFLYHCNAYTYADESWFPDMDPRKFQSEVYTGPITLTQYQRPQWVRDRLNDEGISIPLPTGN